MRRKEGANGVLDERDSIDGDDSPLSITLNEPLGTVNTHFIFAFYV